MFAEGGIAGQGGVCGVTDGGKAFAEHVASHAEGSTFAGDGEPHFAVGRVAMGA